MRVEALQPADGEDEEVFVVREPDHVVGGIGPGSGELTDGDNAAIRNLA